jgi:hypothetical protein
MRRKLVVIDEEQIRGTERGAAARMVGQVRWADGPEWWNGDRRGERSRSGVGTEERSDARPHAREERKKMNSRHNDLATNVALYLGFVILSLCYSLVTLGSIYIMAISANFTRTYTR